MGTQGVQKIREKRKKSARLQEHILYWVFRTLKEHRTTAGTFPDVARNESTRRPCENCRTHVHDGGSKIRLKKSASCGVDSGQPGLAKFGSSRGARGGAAGQGQVCQARDEALSIPTCGCRASVPSATPSSCAPVWADWAAHLGGGSRAPGTCGSPAWLRLTFGEVGARRLRLQRCLNLKLLPGSCPRWPVLAVASSRQG